MTINKTFQSCYQSTVSSKVSYILNTFQGGNILDEILFRISAAIVLFGSSAISIYYRRKANLDTGETVSTKEENKIVFLTIRFSALAAFLSMLTYLLAPSMKKNALLQNSEMSIVNT